MSIRSSPSSSASGWSSRRRRDLSAVGAGQAGMEERLMLQVLQALDEDGERISCLLSGDRLDVLASLGAWATGWT